MTDRPISRESAHAVRAATAVLTAHLADADDTLRPTALTLVSDIYARGGLDALFELVGGLQMVGLAFAGMLSEATGETVDDLLGQIAEAADAETR